jgi:hypothetical protein
MKRKLFSIMLCLFLTVSFTACGNGDSKEENAPQSEAGQTEQLTSYENKEETESVTSETNEITDLGLSEADGNQKEESGVMKMKIGDTPVNVTWENNSSVEELKELAKEGLTISMSMYGGFEQVGSIGQSITRNDKQTTTSAGDIVLYSGNQLVVFYGSNSWSYTRLGKINLSEEELTNLLSNGDITITLSAE